MSYRVKKYQETPNPNALKCVLDRRTGDRTRSYFRAEDAAADPLGAALFSVAGVTNVLINGDWITVSKRPEAGWREVKAGVERVLGGRCEEAGTEAQRHGGAESERGRRATDG